MKKLICFLSLSLVLASCSSDDAVSIQDSSSVLVKKTIETSNDGTLTTVYTYDGNKIVEVSDSDGYRMVYTYTGNLITKMIEYNENDEVTTEDVFVYNAQGQLVQNIFDEIDFKWRYDYIHNADGTISVKKYEAALNTNVYSLTDEGKIYDNKVEETSVSVSDSYTLTFTFDDKNNPFMNVTGFAEIAFSKDMASKNYRNNVLTETYGSNGSTPSISNFSYTYNAANFPVTAVSEAGSSEGATTTQYFYE